MLELKGIKKIYKLGENVTNALDGIDVAFRKTEFVSILGTSGSGKTTLLNIVGGLDRYTDGDLVINGKSTKRFNDRDWYTYRNHIRLVENEQYVITEFLTNVRWAGKYNSINCAAPFHFYEGRWIKNPKYLQSYADFWFTEGANPRVYSAPMADAYYATYLVHADKQELAKHLIHLRDNYQGWVSSHYDEKIGLFYQPSN